MKTKVKKHLLAFLLIILSTIFLNAGLETSVSQTFSTFPITTYGTVSYSEKKMFGQKFGVCVEYGWEGKVSWAQIVDWAAELGVDYVLIDYQWWKSVDRTTFDFGGAEENLDMMVSTLKARGLKPLFRFNASPKWARIFPSTPESPFRDPRDYGWIVKQFVARYDLDVVELWTEPTGMFRGTPEQFIAHQREGYRGAKEANPDCIVIGNYGGGPIWGPAEENNHPLALPNLARLGLLDYLDALDIHCYSDYGSPSQPFAPETRIPTQHKSLRDFLRSVGKGDLRLWAPEWGFGINTHHSSTPNPEVQAEMIGRQLKVLYNEPYVDMSGIFYLIGYGVEDWGLIDRETLEKRPAFYVLKDFITEVKS